MSVWKEKNTFDDETYKEIYKEIDSFFENLQGKKEVEYREGQHLMSLDVLESIKNKEMLLIEAGVGSGKSWGYLVPLLYASKSKKYFNGFLISTSSIALQSQLKEEIEKLSKMLGISIPVTIAKGKNNFICMKRLERFIEKNSSDLLLKKIRKKVAEGLIDKEDYSGVPAKIWENININHNNCNKCLYRKQCQYRLNRKTWPSASYVICNHDLLIEALKRDSNSLILKDPSILIIDEAHNLEDKIRNSYQNSISKNELEALILKIEFMVYDDIKTNEDNPIITSLNKIFRMISKNAKYKYRQNAKTNVEVLDEETSGFEVTLKLSEEIAYLNNKLDTLIKEALNSRFVNEKLLSYVSKLKEYNDIFKDLNSNNRKNIYWVSFLPKTKEHISLEYVRKNIAMEAKKLLSKSDCGKVFTSATMTTSGNYNYFASNLGINDINGTPIIREFPQASPYDYQNNALLYLSNDVISPKNKNHELYLDSLAVKVDELIRITGGRSLVLFTAKEDMKGVYDRISTKEHNFNIMFQTNNANRDKEEFRKDETSVLFATGSFFEGIDVKGESLEQVIITKLPFPTVNPVIVEKASHFTDGFKEVYLPEMIIKLKQGAGRLIRSANDKGIVSILDSRYEDYQEDIIKSLPFTNITTKISDVEEFANEKLAISKAKEKNKSLTRA